MVRRGHHNEVSRDEEDHEQDRTSAAQAAQGQAGGDE